MNPEKYWSNFGRDGNVLWIFCRIYRLYSIDWFKKVEVMLGNQSGCSAEKFRPTYLLLGGNDTVPTSVWRGGGTAFGLRFLATRISK